MKTINKFSGLLLLVTTVLLCSYALVHKGSTDAPKAIASSSAVETGIGILKFEGGTEMKIDTTTKTRTASCVCGRLTVTVVGPDPERVSMCYCHLCQKQTGSAFSEQATFPKEQVTIKGKSTAFKFPPSDGVTAVTGRTCARSGVTTYFCPVCGSTVYYVLADTPDNIGVKAGTFADSTFPAPMISGFEEYKSPWAMNVSALPMPGGHHE
jgi:hypothetical protein